MELNTMQNFFGKNVSILFILDLALRGKKKVKNQKALTHLIKNLAFWMELNTPIKILTVCISSFQSSWYFAFSISWGTKQSLSGFSAVKRKATIILRSFTVRIVRPVSVEFHDLLFNALIF
jgi:hypothetical protein